VSTTAEAPVADPPTAVGTTYLYGIVPAGSVGSIASEGVRGTAVTVLEEGGVAALVSDVSDRELRMTRKDLRRHLDVVDEAFRETTILPCPFGTTVDSREAVVEDVLRAKREALVTGLADLEGTVQLNVKVSHDEDALLRTIVASDPTVARLRRESADDGAYAVRLELGRQVAGAVEAYREADAARLLDALAAEALDVAVEPDDALVLKAAFLVARARQDRFDAVVDRVAATEQELLRFEVIGPLAPTAFVQRVVEV
jgi:hypothetical protein